MSEETFTCNVCGHDEFRDAGEHTHIFKCIECGAEHELNIVIMA